MNNLPDNGKIYQIIREKLEYEFRRWYDVEFYNADNNQRLHFVSLISEYLSDIIQDCLEVD